MIQQSSRMSEFCRLSERWSPEALTLSVGAAASGTPDDPIAAGGRVETAYSVRLYACAPLRLYGEPDAHDNPLKPGAAPSE